MGIVIGMDEAGYGPNYGPLVVAATAWDVGEGGGWKAEGGRRESIRSSSPLSSVSLKSERRNGRTSSAVVEKVNEINLYRPLRGVVCKSSSERRIAIADSKILYKPGLGLRQLERGLHAVLLTLGQSHTCWSALVDGCKADPQAHHRQLPWHEGADCTVPIDATADELTRLGTRLTKVCAEAEVRPLAIRAKLVFPAEFNDLVNYHGTKGAALSHITVGLLRETMELLTQPPVPSPQPLTPSPHIPTTIVCDKHGGRNFYSALLQHHFSEYWIEPICESRAESRYEWGPPESRVRASFRVGGEAFLPTALASMTAKYLRELAMRPFNEFWCARVKDLRPTAGYPLDARRFRKEIATEQRKLGIQDHVLWRNR